MTPTDTVWLPAGAFAALRLWPAILHRVAHSPYSFLPLGFLGEVNRVRSLLDDAQHTSSSADGSVRLTDELREALVGWCAYVERAKWSGMAPLSLEEQMAIADWLPTIKEAVE